MSKSGSSGKSRRVSNGLVGLSSAAVLTIYGAGYVRTRPAAAKFALAAERRHPAPAAAAAVPITAAAEPPAVAASMPEASVPPSPSTVSALPPLAAPPPTPTTEPPGRAARPEPAPAASTAVVKQPLPGNLPPTELPPTPAASSVVAPAKVAAPPAPTPAVTSAAAVAPAAAPDPSAASASAPPAAAPPAAIAAPVAAAPAPAAPAAPPAAAGTPKWKDGTFLGWGTSRHGDIEASVVIQGGRILSATISQCLTRYSCSWIAPLPPQVVARQSQEVDYVSGATQSTNAFYDAVVDALSKAK